MRAVEPSPSWPAPPKAWRALRSTSRSWRCCSKGSRSTSSGPSRGESRRRLALLAANLALELGLGRRPIELGAHRRTGQSQVLADHLCSVADAAGPFHNPSLASVYLTGDVPNSIACAY